MTFWILATILALMVAGLLVLALWRGRIGAVSPAAYDLQVYRDQLKEVDRDLARGVVAKPDAERARIEISRRILAADAQMQAGEGATRGPAGLSRAAGLVLVLAMLGGSVGLYSVLGTPGYGDLPIQTRLAMAQEAYETRPSQDDYVKLVPPAPTTAEPSPEYLDLLEKLRQKVAERPDDLQGHQLLARNEAAMGNFDAAAKAQTQILRLKGDDVTARDHVILADLMINAAAGYVSPEAEAALDRALALDPGNQMARFYRGLMFMQVDRPDIAFRTWEQLLREGPETAPWIAPIRGQLEELAWRAGIDYQLPDPAPALAGPSEDDVASAAEMDDADRQEMIRGMVDRLNTRLAESGGTPAEWSRLIAALGVLGDTDQAQVVWTEAQQVFANAPDALAEVRAGAMRAGLVE